MTGLRLTTSWDDGHPADLRLAEHLSRHRIAATFYVPIRNHEGRPVMDGPALRALAAGGFEIAAHTLDHQRLPSLAIEAARRQIVEGRQRLEDMIGAPVTGFAYPGGRRSPALRALVAETGFRYARTVKMLCAEPGDDRYGMATTAQFFPHGAGAMLRNWLRQGGGGARLAMAARWIAASGLDAALEACAAETLRRGGVLHVWGHSWEIADHDLWASLERFCTAIAARVPIERRLTNGEIAA